MSGPDRSPAVLVAGSRLEVLAGFRAPHASADLLAALDLARLAPHVARLRDETPGGGDPVRAVAGDLLAEDEAAPLAHDVAVAARRAVERLHRSAAGRFRLDPSRREALRALELVVRQDRDRHGDPAVLVAVLMNHLVVPPRAAVVVDRSVPWSVAAGAGVRCTPDGTVERLERSLGDPVGVGPLDLDLGRRPTPSVVHPVRRGGVDVLRPPGERFELVLPSPAGDLADVVVRALPQRRRALRPGLSEVS